MQVTSFYFLDVFYFSAIVYVGESDEEKEKLQVTVIHRWLLSPPKNGRANLKVLREQERLEPFTKLIMIIIRIKNIL